jgi:hypothetical protein
VRGLVVFALFVLPFWRGAAWSSTQQDATEAEEDVLLPSAKGDDLTRQLCGSCHGLGSFTGLRMTRADWDTMIGVMIDYGAVMSDEESGVVGRYLAEVFGPDSPPLVDANRADKEDLAKLPGVDATAADKLLQYRARKGRFENFKQVQNILGAEAFERVKGYLTVR